MRSIPIIVFVLCLLSGAIYPQVRSSNPGNNRIDLIKNARDIEDLLDDIDKKHFELFQVAQSVISSDKLCQNRANEIKINAWLKADFDGNALTDLLVHGSDYEPRVIVIMSEESNKFSWRSLTRGVDEKCAFASVKNLGSLPLITYSAYRTGNPGADIERALVYKFGDFVEFIESPPAHSIEKITYETSICFG